MQIFVSWSGRPAQELASFLQTWLRRVIQELDPFMSTNSIAKGSRWSPEIAKRLEETSEAIVCVTSENQNAPWLNFEAGALAKATGSRVRPLLIDLAPSDVDGPLSEFQLTSASDKDDVRRMIEGINENCNRPLQSDILSDTFEREWPALAAKVQEVQQLIGGQANPKRRKRDDPELLDEVLSRVRAVERLTQDQVYISQRLHLELLGEPWRRRANQGHANEVSQNRALTTQKLLGLLDRIGPEERVRVVENNNRIHEGKILSVSGEMPDTVLAIGDDAANPSLVAAVSISRIMPINEDGVPH